MRRAASLLLIVLVAACTTLAIDRFDQLFGPADPKRFDHPLAPPPGESYAQTIQPILDRRCVVCHACYDGPCQLKATAWEGLARGASKTPVYDAARLLAAPPTRLFVDAQQPSQWRDMGFFPVLNEHTATPEANRTAGLMHRLLVLKEKNPLPTHGTVGGGLDFGIDREAMCPAGAQIDDYERKMPLGGMPFGLPGLAPAEQDALKRWIERGAPFEGPPEPTPLALQRIAMWERFLNGDSPKERLFSRYAFEHLFLAHLYFDDDPQRKFFRIVRSATPPGQPVQLIASRRPVDDPGIARPYYRLVPERETIVAKTHMPYQLGAARMARWRELFLDAPFTVDRLPGYSAQTASNPFSTFAALPVDARYRFMLDEAEFTIMGFIKGPVCRGQMALDVIEDRFWVNFAAPGGRADREQADLLAKEADLLRLPTGSSNERVLAPWLEYARLENRYLRVKTEFLARSLGGPEQLDLRLLWDGDGNNDNAGLTVFRHFDSASVVKGLVGEAPKSAWVIGYALLERIHYLLVANYDVFGNVGHQLNSRLYMDFLRMEGEFNFLILLPQAQRIATRDQWYRADSQATRDQVYGGPSTTLAVDSGIRYQSADPRRELMGMMKDRLAKVLPTNFSLERAPVALQQPLRRIEAVRGAALQWMPEEAALVVEAPGVAPATYTLLRNTAHATVSHLVGEGKELLPDESTLTLVPGVIGAYPNAFYRVGPAQLPAMAEAIAGLRSEADYAAFSERFAVRRTDPAFWAVSDGLVERYRRDQPLQAGILDLNRFENR